jgi:hypothetical protein
MDTILWSISILKLLNDFGLLVLIWMIQLIVYPSFLYYKTENLVVWHRRYTPLIGGIVAPLMVLQLGIAIYQITILFSFFNVINLVVVVIIWASTVSQFVPIHSNISKGRVSEKMLLSLVKKNWLRTILWTLLFILSVLGSIFGNTI